jgi:predicted nucleic acid-binding protein
MKRVVLDASAVMTFFENRPGAAKVEALLQQAVAGKLHLFMSVVNWGEVYYSTGRAHAQLPIEIVEAGLDLTRTAAELRADHTLPYTDCFAAALAAQRKASLATSDQDFATVEKKIDILWTIA